MLSLERRFEEEDHGPAEDQHAGHDAPEDLTALFALRSLESVSAVTRVAFRALPGMLFQKTRVVAKQFFAVEPQEFPVVPHEAADEG